MRAVKPIWVLFFVLGACVAGTLALLDNWERISAWVRKVFPVTASGARASDSENSQADQVSGAEFQPDKIAAKLGRFLSSMASFLWRWKLPLLVVAFFMVGANMFGCTPFDWGKSKDTLRAERDSALIDKTVAERETAVANRAIELAEETHADTARVREIVRQADEEIADAVQQDDFDLLWAVYDRSYRGVWSLSPTEDFPDPPAPGPDNLRGAGADRA